MLQVLSPAAPPTSSFEDSSSATTTHTPPPPTTTTDSCAFGHQGGLAVAGITTSEYCDQLDIANFFLEMAAKRPFSSLRDEDSTLPSGSNSPVPRMRGGRIPTTTTRSDMPTPPSLPPTPGLPPPTPPTSSQSQLQSQAKSEQASFSPPPPSDVEVYEKRPLPALPLPGKRHSGSSTLSKELNVAFATPHRSGAFFEGEEDQVQSQAQSQSQSQEPEQHPGGAPSVSDDMDWEEDEDEETEIRVVLDRPSEGVIKAQHLPQPVGGTDMRFRVSSSPSPSLSPSRLQQSEEILSPQPSKLALQKKLLRLTGSVGRPNSKIPVPLNTPSHPIIAPGASSTPSGHNSMHKIKQLMGVDVAPRESSSSEFLRRARWSHQDDDDVFASDQDIDMSDRGCFLDSDDDSGMEDVPPAAVSVAPTSAPMVGLKHTGRRNRFDNDNSSRAESPIPAPLLIKKHHRDLLYDIDDAVVRPSSSAGERRLGLDSHHQYQHQYSSSSSLHYREDLYHRTTVQLSRASNNNNNNNNYKPNDWRNSGTGSSITGESTSSQPPPTTRESHGGSSVGSGSQLLKTPIIDPDKPLPSPPRTASGRIPDTPQTWSSSPGLPTGRIPMSPEPSITSQPQPQPQPEPRKRATSTGAFGNMVGQRWQNWQQQHRQPQPPSPSQPQQQQQQQQQPRTSSPRQNKAKHPKVRIPYDPSTDPHPGIRIILPYELEEEEFPVSSSSSSPTTAKSQHRASIVSSLLKRISGTTPTSPHGHGHGHGHGLGHKKRPSEPATPTWLSGGGPGLGPGPGPGLGPGIQPLSSPIGMIPPGPPVLLDSLPLTPMNKVISPGSAAAATIPISASASVSTKSNTESPHLSLPLFPRPQSPRSQPQPSPLQPVQPVITKTTMFGIQTEQQQHQQHQHQSQSQPQPLPAQSQFSPQPQTQTQTQSQTQFQAQAQGGIRSQLPGNQRSSFSISEPPSPILSSLASLGHLNLSSGALGLGLGGRPNSSKGESRDRDEHHSGTTKRSMSSLGFRSPPHLQLQLGPGLRAVADRSTLIAQRTNELVGQVSKRLVSLSKKDKDKGDIKEKEKEKGDTREKERGDNAEEKWREDIKSKIRVLDDGGRVLGMGGQGGTGVGVGSGVEMEIPLALASPKLLPPLGLGLTPRTAPPERPERSPIVPGTEPFGSGLFHQDLQDITTAADRPDIMGEPRPGLEGMGIITDTDNSNSNSGGTTNDQEQQQQQQQREDMMGTGQEREEMTGLRSPPPIPPRSKARPISGIGIGFNNPNTAGMSALASVGFGASPSGCGNGSRPGSRSGAGSRPGSSRGVLRDAFAGSGSNPGSRPGSAGRGNGNAAAAGTPVPNRDGLGSRDGRDAREGTFRGGVERGATEELETWV